MKKILIVLGLGAFFALAPVQVVVTNDAVVVTQLEAKAQVICCAPPPPVGGGTSAAGGGAGGGQYFALGIIAVATYYAALNPRKGSDSILANIIHGEWPCALWPKKDPRPRCDVHNTLTLAQQLRLRKLAGLPSH